MAWLSFISCRSPSKSFKNGLRDFILVVQGLRLHTSIAGGVGSVLVGKLRSHELHSVAKKFFENGLGLDCLLIYKMEQLTSLLCISFIHLELNCHRVGDTMQWSCFFFFHLWRDYYTLNSSPLSFSTSSSRVSLSHAAIFTEESCLHSLQLDVA